jgi:hypothetical protein
MLWVCNKVHPPGYVHQLFADAVVASVLHPALVKAAACGGGGATPNAQALKPVPPLPPPLDAAADPTADDVVAQCLRPLTLYSASLSPPPLPYAYPLAAPARAAYVASRSGAVPFAPLAPPRGWAFGPDLAGKPNGWITPAER